MLKFKMILRTSLSLLSLAAFTSSACAVGPLPGGLTENSPQNSPAKRQKLERISSELSESYPEEHGEKRLAPDEDLQISQEMHPAKRQNITRMTNKTVSPLFQPKRGHGKGKDSRAKRLKKEEVQTLEQRFPLTPAGYRALSQAMDASDGDLELVTEWIKRTTFEDLEKLDTPKPSNSADPSPLELDSIKAKNHLDLLNEAFADESYNPLLVDELFERIFCMQLPVEFLHPVINKLQHLLTRPEVYTKILEKAEYANVFFSHPTLRQDLKTRYPGLLTDLKKKARKNTKDSMISLAFFYKNNKKIADYLSKYTKWIRRADQAENPKSLIYAGETYVKDAESDPAKARIIAEDYFLKNKGSKYHAAATYKLGEFYHKTNPQKAHKYFARAKAWGINEAFTTLALMYQDKKADTTWNGLSLSPEEKEKHIDDLFKKAANLGDPIGAQHHSVRLLFDIQHKSKKSSDQLARDLRNKTPSSRAFETQAKDLFCITHRASIQDQSYLALLGYFFEIGLGTEPDPLQALTCQLLSNHPGAHPFVTSFLLNNQKKTVVTTYTEQNPCLDLFDLLHRTQRQQRKKALKAFVSKIPHTKNHGWFTHLRSPKMQEHIQSLIAFNKEAIDFLDFMSDIEPGFLIDAVRPSKELEHLLAQNPQESLSIVTLKNRNYFNLGQKNQTALKEMKNFKGFRKKIKETKGTLHKIRRLFLEARQVPALEAATTNRFVELIKEQKSILQGLEATYMKFFTHAGLGARNADFLKTYTFWND